MKVSNLFEDEFVIYNLQYGMLSTCWTGQSLEWLRLSENIYWMCKTSFKGVFRHPVYTSGVNAIKKLTPSLRIPYLGV